MSSTEGMGTLYLMPVWLGEAGGIEQLPPENIALAARIDLYFCEHERTARQMLRRMIPSTDLQRIEMHRLDKDTSSTEIAEMISLLKQDRDGAIISEAGMPGIADPGALLVRAAHQRDVRVVPLIGPSSLPLALAASGLNGQSFIFHGYLPVKPNERKSAIKRLEQEALRTGTAQIFIETPYRNDALLADLLSSCSSRTVLTIACDLTQPAGSVRSMEIDAWKNVALVIGKRPTVFVLGSWAR